jgi:hydrogenase maturation factor
MLDKKELLRVGKLSPQIFDEIIFSKIGAPDDALVVKPMHGVDAAVLRVGDRVMAVAEDPTFGVPSWGWKQFGWGVVHICAGDVAVMGVKPQYMSICLLLPLGTPRDVLEEIWSAIHEACLELNITIVGGHTGSYGGINYPLNGGCTVWGFADLDKYVTPAGAQVGDEVLITKGAAIEATGILALQYPKALVRRYSEDLVKRAQAMYWQMSVIEDAVTAYDTGGVTAMHDATEGGVLGGLFEVAQASAKGMEIHLDRIKVSDEAEKICSFFDIDPYISISEGTLVLTVRPDRTYAVMRALDEKEIESMIIGKVKPLEEGRRIVQDDGSEFDLRFPGEDPFWGAFFKTLEQPDQ